MRSIAFKLYLAALVGAGLVVSTLTNGCGAASGRHAEPARFLVAAGR